MAAAGKSKNLSRIPNEAFRKLEATRPVRFLIYASLAILHSGPPSFRLDGRICSAARCQKAVKNPSVCIATGETSPRHSVHMARVHSDQCHLLGISCFHSLELGQVCRAFCALRPGGSDRP